jgi:hypothetical protein
MHSLALQRHESAFGAWTEAVWRPQPGSPLAGRLDRVWYFDGTLGQARERASLQDTASELPLQCGYE